MCNITFKITTDIHIFSMDQSFKDYVMDILYVYINIVVSITLLRQKNVNGESTNCLMKESIEEGE